MQAVNAGERLRVVVGAAFGLLLAGALSHAAMPGSLAWFVAPLGASAVLVFGVPASPLAPPCAVLGGHTVDAPVGIAGLGARLQSLLKPSPATHSAKPEVVGQTMSRQVRAASAERRIAGLVPLLPATATSPSSASKPGSSASSPSPTS